MKETKSKKSLKILPNERKGSLETSNNSLGANNHKTQGAAQEGETKLMLSELINGRSTMTTGEPKSGVQRIGGGVNKSLKMNLQNIFKGSGMHPTEKERVSKNVHFKIGKSQDSVQLRSTHFSQAHSGRLANRDQSKPRETSLNKIGSKKSFQLSQERQDARKKLQKPPVPKATRPITKAADYYRTYGCADGNTFKLNINVEITSTRPTEETVKLSTESLKVPPRPPCIKKPQKHQNNCSKETKLVNQRTTQGSETNLPPINRNASKDSRGLTNYLDGGSKASLQSNQYEDNIESLHQKAKIPKIRENSHRQTITETSIINIRQKDRMRDARRVTEPIENSKNPIQVDDVLIHHQSFVSAKRQFKPDRRRSGDCNYEKASSCSKLGTPQIVLEVSENNELMESPISMFKRRNSDDCISSNSRNKIKWYLSDKVTRTLFEKVYKKKLRVQLDSSFFD